MSGVNIEYKGESIATIPDTGSKTIKTQGKYCEGDILVEYEAPPTPTPVEEKYINFIDYDGTVLYSWTEEELQEATELPPLPIKEGYTNLGWNWDLVNLKTQPFPIWVGVYGVKPVNSSSALLYEFNPDDPLDIAIQIDSMQSGKTLTVDYGDGTTDTLSANGTFSHTFSTAGKYLVKFAYDETNFRLISVATGERNIIEAFIGEDTELSQNIFASAYSLVNLSLSAQKQIVYNVIGGGRSTCLNCWIIPKGATNCDRIGASRTVTSIPYSVTAGIYVVFGNYNVLNKEIMLHNNITTVGESMFWGIRNVKTISIPKSVTTIQTNAFGGIYEKQNVDLSEYDDPTNIPTLENINAFSGASNIGSIFTRNQSMLDAFAGATNWSTYAAKFVIGGKFAEVTP